MAAEEAVMILLLSFAFAQAKPADAPKAAPVAKPPAVAKPAAEAALAEFRGAWRGSLRLRGAGKEVPMGLDVLPLPGGELTWRLTYGDGPGKQVRDYRLRPAAKGEGFDLDERNGIVIPMRLAGGALVGCFSVAGQRLVSRYERMGEALRMEILVFDDAPASTANVGGTEVNAFRLRSSQDAELRRAVDSAPRDAEKGKAK